MTLFEDLRGLGLEFDLTPGDQIVDGAARINAALDYDQEQGLSFFNKPRLYVSAECPNTIYALENWMNVDGEHGACKDPIDNLRYYYTSEAGVVGENDYRPKGGGWYGRGVKSVGGGGTRGRARTVGLVRWVRRGPTVRARGRPACMGTGTTGDD